MANDKRKQSFNWYNDGEKNIKIYADDDIPSGFTPGRCRAKKDTANVVLVDTPKIDSLEGLSDEEKKVALQILQEIADDGVSDTYSKLQYADFNEIPVDIITFLKDERYLGKAWHTASGKCKLFPYWENKLKELFPDNLTTNYNTFILSGARGLGKSEISVACGLYLMYRIMCLKNPLDYYNLKPTEKFVFAFMNIKLDLAEEIGISKLQNTVQMSPWFMSRGTLTGKTNIKWNPPDYIEIKIGSDSSAVIGLPIIFAFFDEISFIKNMDVEIQKRKAIDMIDTAIGGMKTRFTNKGKNPSLLCLGSSKRSEKSFLETHIKEKQETDGENTLIVDEPVWNVRPPEEYSGVRFPVALGNKFLVSQVIKDNVKDFKPFIDRGYRILDVPIEYREKFLEDIDRALCDYAGISSSELSTYISGERWAEAKNPDIQNPFVSDEIEVGNAKNDVMQYYNFFDLSRVDSRLKSRPLFVHLDMSLTGDKTGIAGVWIVSKDVHTGDVPPSRELHFRLAFSVSIKAPKGYQVSFEKNRQFIYWLRESGFNLKAISSDTFQSADLGQTLLAKGYDYSVISVDRVDTDHICKPYQYFRSAIYEDRFEAYDDCPLLTKEILSLERNNTNGKIDHPVNGCFTGDTLVRLVDGRSLSFLELIDEYEKGKVNYVYSVNLDKKCIEPKRITKAWKTLENQKLVRITFDNGESVECTYNHRFMLRNGSYVEAQNLIPGDPMMSLYTKVSSKGLRGVWSNRYRAEKHKICNHTVVSVEYIDKVEDVYDIEVEDNHNFALDCGVFVHNSKDQSDAVCGATWNASQHAEEFAYEYGESINTMLDVNSDDSDEFDMNKAFEEELSTMLDPLSKNNELALERAKRSAEITQQNINKQFNQYNQRRRPDTASISEGIMVW